MGKRTEIIINKLLWMSFFTSQILAEDVPVYGLVNGEVMLTPESFSEKLDRILWKLGEDKAAEWELDTLDYFRIFKGPASLNKATGTLTLRKLTTEFNGFYSAEINGKPSTKRTNLIVISRVSKPSIEKQCNESVCMLSCKTTPTVEDHYSWMKDGEDLGNRDSDLKLVKSDKVLGKAYMCNYSNPLSYALSDDIVPIPFVPVSKPSIEKQCNESVCMLSCKTTPTFNDHYTWMKDGEDIGNRDSELKVVKSDKVLGKAYKCNYSNPLSYALSDDIVPIPIVPVSKPSIEKQCNESVCYLSCKTTPTFNDHYTWMKDGVDIGNRDRDLKLVKNHKVLDKAYKCNYSNPSSFALSDHIVPFPSDGGPKIGPIVGGILAIVALIAIAVIMTKYGKELDFYTPSAVGLQEIWQRISKGLQEIWQRISKGRTSENPGGNPEAGANDAAAEEMLPKGGTPDIKETAS